MRPSRPGKTGSHSQSLARASRLLRRESQSPTGHQQSLRLRPLPSTLSPIQTHCAPARHPRPNPSSVHNSSPHLRAIPPAPRRETPSPAPPAPSAAAPPRIRRRRCCPSRRARTQVPAAFHSVLQIFQGKLPRHSSRPPPSIPTRECQTAPSSDGPLPASPPLSAPSSPISPQAAQSIHPPLTLSTCPVTYSASSDAKNATDAATSSTVGGRPIGYRASRSLRASSTVRSFSSMLEGFTTFTVIPFFASSSASERDSATTAAFAAAYALIFAWPNARSAPTAPRFTIRPQRPLRITGKAVWHIRNTLITFESNTLFHSSSEDSASVFHRKSPTLFTRI